MVFLKKLKITKEILYYFFISLIVFIYMLEAVVPGAFNETMIHEILQISAILCAFMYIFANRYSRKEIVELVILNFIGIFCYISSGNSNLFMVMLAITLLPVKSFDKIIEFIFVEEVILFVSVIISAMFEILPNDTVYVWKGTYAISARAYGFGHPNRFGAQAISIVLLWVFVNRRTISAKKLCVATIVICGVLLLSGSRVSFSLGMLAVVLISLRNNKYLKDVFFCVFPWSYFIVLLFLASCMIVYGILGHDNKLVAVINDGLFNGRIGLAYRSLFTFPISMFGKQLDLNMWGKEHYFALDNTQIKILLEYGIVGFLTYFYIFQRILDNINKEKEYIMAVLIMIFLVWSMYENTMYFIGNNFALFLWAYRKCELKKVRREF